MMTNYKSEASVKANRERAGKKKSSAQACGEAQVKRIAELEAENTELRKALHGVVVMYGPSSEYDGEAQVCWERAEAVLGLRDWVAAEPSA